MKAMTYNEINNIGRRLMKFQKLNRHLIIIKIKILELDEIYRQEIIEWGVREIEQTNIPLIPPYSTEMFANTSDIVLKFKMMGFDGLRGILLKVIEDCGELLFTIRPTKIINNTYKIINVYSNEIEYISEGTIPVQLSLFPEYRGE